MSETWVSADWHLGEDRFKIMQRPFSTAEEMVETLLERHNKLVKPEDTVIVNGDVCYQKAPEWLPWVAKFNGQKILIRGNHDRVFSDTDLVPYFSIIVPEGDGKMLTSIDSNVAVAYDATNTEIPLWITHYPSRAKDDAFNLVGHIHGAWKYQLNSLNVGVDVHNFAPVNVKDVPFFFQAITKFYDDDVWAAYHPSNEKYRTSRGVRGSYFDKKI
jgi:calcineurin-like phosphoesterase family protein